MKKIIIISILIFSFILVGCVNSNDSKIDANKYLDKEYNEINIQTTSSKDNYSLSSTYNLKKEDGNIILSYAVEKYNKLDLNNPNIEEKTTVHGVIEYVNGERKVIEGEDIDLDISGMNLNNLKYNNYNFDSIDIDSDKTILKAKKITNYLKQGETFTDFYMVIKYFDESINGIEIEYKDSNDFDVSIIYSIK